METGRFIIKRVGVVFSREPYRLEDLSRGVCRWGGVRLEMVTRGRVRGWYYSTKKGSCA